MAFWETLGKLDQSTEGKKNRPRREPVIVPPQLPADRLAVRIDPNGSIVNISDQLARRLQIDPDEFVGKSFAGLVRQHFTWINLLPDQWPKELPVMRVSVGNSGVFYFSGSLLAEYGCWLIQLVDVSEIVLRLETSDLQGRLFRRSEERRVGKECS